jgi:hypothetical protein
MSTTFVSRPLSLQSVNPGSRQARKLRWPVWGALIILAGYALFSHGCHWGDEDTELLIRTSSLVAGPFAGG